MVEITSHRIVADVEDEWENLADRLSAPPFLRPGWIEAWARAFGAANLEILAARVNGRLEGLLPLLQERRVTRSTSNWHTPLYGMLASNDGIRGRLVQELFHPGVERIWLGFLDGDALEVRDLQAAAARARYHVVLRTLERSPYVTIRGDWASFEESLRPSVRAELRRKVRRLEREGRVELDVRDGAHQLDDLLAEGFEIESSGWKGDRGSAITSRPETAQFYSEVARWAAARGWLRLAYLRLDGCAIAFQYALEDGEAWYNLKSGYRPHYQRFSPGRLLVCALLQRCFAVGLARDEFLGGDEPYKLEWTSTAHDRILFHAFARSPGGLARWSLHAHGHPLAKRLGAARIRALLKR